MDNNLIYSKMVAIMKATKAICKSKKNQQQGFMFRGIDDVMNELHNIFAENDVFILPEVKEFETEARPTKSGGVMTYTRATCKFTFTTTDGSSVPVTTIGEAMDSGDKSMNKAMSIALKYALLQMLLIPTEEQKDPDADTPEEQDGMLIALDEVNRCKNRDELANVWKRWSGFQKSEKFINAVTIKGKEFK